MSSTVIIQFAKLPVLGKVKTRLQDTLGEDGCLSLHENLVQHTANEILKTNFSSALFITEQKPHPLMDRLADSMSLMVQEGEDLGERMYQAFQWGLAQYDRVILVGSDCPVITTRHYELVNKSLEENDFCFIPAEDGGYVLVAAKKLDAEIFRDINWGTDKVWQQTQEKLKGKSVAVLEPLWDVDRSDDFNRLKQTIPSLCVL